MVHRGWTMLAILAAFLVLAGAGAMSFRTMIASGILRAVLAERGLAMDSAVVSELGLNRARITGIAHGPLAVKAVLIDYRLAELPRWRLDRITIEGLVLAVDLTQGGAPFADLDLQGADATAFLVPPIHLVDARVIARTEAGPVSVQLDGEVTMAETGVMIAAASFGLESPFGEVEGIGVAVGDGGGALTGQMVIDRGELVHAGASAGLAGTLDLDLDLSGGALARFAADIGLNRARWRGAELGAGHVTVAVTPDAIAADGIIGGQGGGVTVRATGRVRDYLSRPRLALELHLAADAGAGAPLLERLPLPMPAPKRGVANATLSLEGPVPPPAAWSEVLAAPRAWMADGEWDGRLSLAIRDADWPGYGSGFSAGATMVGKWFGGALSVSLPIDAWANLSGLDTDLVAKTGLAGFAQGGIELRIPAAGAAPFSLAIRPLRDGLDLAASGTMRVESAAGGVFEAAGELRIAGEETVRGTGRIDLVHDEIVAGPVAAKDLRIRLPVAFTIAPDRLHLALSGDGAWRASVPRIGGVAVAADDLVLEIANGTLEAWRADSGADWALSYAALVRPGAFAGVIDAGLAEPVRVETGWQSIAVDGVGASGADVGGRVVIAGATVAVPGYGLGAKGVEAVLSIPPSESAPLARFSIARLGHGGVSPLVVPLAAEGTVWAGDSGLTFGVELRDLAANKWIEINGSHNPETGEGEGLIAMPATLLAPSGRQLNDLTPILEPLGAVAGSVRAEVRLGWTENGLRQSGFLGLDDVSMAMAAASVSGLNAEIRFDGLLPPSTPPAQLATVRRLDAAVPMTDLVIRFALPSESPPRLILDSAVAGFAGGVVSVGETTLGPALARQTLPLAISGLDLAELFALLDLDGVAGSGVIDGTLPLAITDGVVTLNGGNLRARGPGALQIQSAAVATALAGGGEPVALMLRAMENFAFDSLSMEIDKDAAGDAVLKLQMAGRNPDLDAGRPFEFNINLDTNLDRVLAAIGEGARLTNELLSRAWGLIP